MEQWLQQEIDKRKQQVVDAVGDKYNHCGLYEIYLNDKLVYIGKSTNMLHRIASHMLAIDGIGKDANGWKYEMIRQAKADGYGIRFAVAEVCSSDELSLEEAKSINRRKPILNLQLPALDGSKSWSWNPNAKGKSYQDLKKYLDQ